MLLVFKGLLIVSHKVLLLENQNNFRFLWVNLTINSRLISMLYLLSTRNDANVFELRNGKKKQWLKTKLKKVVVIRYGEI